MLVLGSRGLFTVEHPDHEVTLQLNAVADRLLAELDSAES